MRAITLTQPWAGLVAAGIKLVENRNRPIIGRGFIGQRIAIHASREIDYDVYERVYEIAPEIRPEPAMHRWYPLTLITSSVIATAILDSIVDPRACGIDPSDPAAAAPLAEDQRRWFFGPIGYVLRDVRELVSPVRCRGMLGCWTLPPDVDELVAAQIARVA